VLAIVYKIRHYFEKHGFYVSSRLADRFGVKARNIRLFFIYISFATLGVGFAMYLTMAFFFKIKRFIVCQKVFCF
jgi:hypothetical protein